MGEKKYYKKSTGGRLVRCMLLVMLAFVLTTGSATVVSAATEVSAVSKKKTKIRLEGKSGRYIIDTGYNWWLKEKNGRKVTGFQYIKVPKGNRLKSGYYMFDSKGCLCKKKQFHKLNKTISGKTFKGTYYFGDTNGRLYRKSGWKVINGQKYLLSPYGRRYENCWRYGYYLQSNGTIARSRRLPDGTWVDCNGRRCTEADMTLKLWHLHSIRSKKESLNIILQSKAFLTV